MTEGVSSGAEDAAAARAAEQARLRKERREAKIKAGGTARLNKITGLGGGIQRDPPTPAASTTSESVDSSAAAAEKKTQPPSDIPPQHGDPEEIDISQHFYQPRATPRRSPGASTPDLSGNLSEAQLRQMMLSFETPTGRASPFPGSDGGAADEDPMAKLFAQMMAGLGGPGGGGDGSPFAQFAQGLSAGGQGQRGAGAPGVVATPDRYAAVWRVLHTAVALALGLYIALATSFSGARVERDRAAVRVGGASVVDGGASTVDVDGIDRARMSFFWAFATAEAVLLTSRYFLDRGRAPPAGFLWSVAGVLPPPFRGYLETGLRYWQILGTVRADLLVCIFVLGVCSWVRAS